MKPSTVWGTALVVAVAISIWSMHAGVVILIVIGFILLAFAYAFETYLLALLDRQGVVVPIVDRWRWTRQYLLEYRLTGDEPTLAEAEAMRAMGFNFAVFDAGERRFELAPPFRRSGKADAGGVRLQQNPR